jgi:predicted secreted protein
MVVLVMAATAEKITYVDATHGEAGNTKLASGGVFTPTTENSGTDNLWRLRTGFANSGTVYESGGTFSDPPGVNTEDCPRLVTTVSGLPDGTYKIYIYFWSDDSNWRIRADLKGKDAQLPLFYSRALEQETAPIGAPAAALAKADEFKAVPLLSEGNRMLWQAYLGKVKGKTITVFVDDDPAHKTHSCRTWYDGIGYQAVTQ